MRALKVQAEELQQALRLIRAVKELELNYQNSETPLFGVYPHDVSLRFMNRGVAQRSIFSLVCDVG